MPTYKLNSVSRPLIVSLSAILVSVTVLGKQFPFDSNEPSPFTSKHQSNRHLQKTAPDISSSEALVFGPETFHSSFNKHLQPKWSEIDFSVSNPTSFSDFTLIVEGHFDPLSQLEECKNLSGFKKLKCYWLKRSYLVKRVIERLRDKSHAIVDLNGDRLNVKGTNEYKLNADWILSSNTLRVKPVGPKGYSITLKIVGKVKDTQPANILPVALATVNSESGLVPFTAMFDGSLSSDSDGSIVFYEWDFGDGSTATGPQVTHQFNEVGSYSVTLKVIDNRGGEATTDLTVTAEAVPETPDPIDIAPILRPSQSSGLLGQVDFLFSGENPIQKNVLPGAIEEDKAIVLRGQILDRNNNPLSGVRVEVNQREAFGYTMSREDGRYDLVLNGGRQVVVSFTRNGYFKTQRSVKTTFNKNYELDEVVLVAQDPNVTAVAMGQALTQVAQGSPQVDSSGERQATVIFPSGTEAELLFENGTRRTISNLNVRATEYTVGENGQKAMPAALPKTSAYTYAVELSADEAVALGAEHIEFNKPVSFYVENFLGFSVGGIVPVGKYDYKIGAWVPQKNGRVIEILSEENGQAVLAVTSSGQEATSDELAKLGIDTEELIALANTYEPGQTLWRAQTSSFSTYDLNWPSDAEVPENVVIATEPPKETNPSSSENPINMCGSIIDVEAQTLGEVIPLGGVGYGLHYTTARVPGREANSSVVINLISSELPEGLKRVDLKVNTAGNVFERSFTPSENLSYTYTWDGLDAYERALNSKAVPTITVSYAFESTYLESMNTESDFSFALTIGGFTATEIPGRGETIYEKSYEARPLWTAENHALSSIGGWTLSIHHRYDPHTKTLSLGTGEDSIESDKIDILKIIAGNKQGLPSDIDGLNAKDVNLSGVGALTQLSTGQYLFYEPSANQVRSINKNGTLHTFAGNGSAGYSGDGGEAQFAQIGTIGAIDEGPLGEVYLVDTSFHVIRKVTSDGFISTVAGTGVAGFSGDNGPATIAQLSSPTGISVGSDGALYIADAGNALIRRIDPAGRITTIAGNGESTFGFTGEEAPLNAALGQLDEVVFSESNGIYFNETSEGTILRLDNSGQLSQLVGTFEDNFFGDGAPASDHSFTTVTSLDVTNSNEVIFSDGVGIYKINTLGRLNRIAGDLDVILGNIDSFNNTKNNIWALESGDLAASHLSINQQGEIIFSQSESLQIVKIASPFASEDGETYRIASKDAQEIYIFNKEGLHLKTISASSYNLIWEFKYNEQNLLVGIVDRHGKIAEISRDSDTVYSFKAPYGQETTFQSSGFGGYLSSVTNVLSETYSMSYIDGGLLASFTNPNQATTTFLYDEKGNLIKDTDALGGYQELTKNEETGFIEYRTIEGLLEKYSFDTQATTGDAVQTSETTSGTLRRIAYTNGQIQSELPQDYEVSATSYTNQTNNPRIQSGSFASSTFIDVRFNSNPGSSQPFAQFFSHFDFIETPSHIGSNSDEIESIRSVPFGSAPYTYHNNITQNEKTIEFDSGRTVFQKYNNKDQIVLSQASGLFDTTYEYNSEGQLILTTQGDRSTSYTYNQYGFVETSTDAQNRVTTFETDPLGKVLSVTTPDQKTTYFTYDSMGNRTSVQPSERPLHNFEFNLLNYVTAYDPPPLLQGPVKTTYAYDKDKKLTQIRRPDGRVLDYIYDTNGKLQRIETEEGVYYYTYNPLNGKVETVTAPNGIRVGYSYKGPETDQITYRYQEGQEESFVNYFLNPQLRPGYVRNLDSTLNIILYFPGGDVSDIGPLTIDYNTTNYFPETVTLYNTQETYTYNDYGEVKSATNTYNGTTLYSASYERDSLGRIEALTENILGSTTSKTYTYDPAGRLETATSQGVTTTYTYGKNGNRDTKAAGPVTVAATYDDQDRLLSYGENTYTYNINGELKTKTTPAGTTTYSYNSFGTLENVTLPDGKVITYRSDYKQRRMEKYIDGEFAQRFLYQDDLKIFVELNQDGTIKSDFVYYNNTNVPEFMNKINRSTNIVTTYRIITNHLGSVQMVVNADTGEIAQQMQYDEFGNVTLDTNPGFQPFGFAGGIYDRDTGLTRFGARDYNANIGRWLSMDPIKFAGGSPNFYQYAMNDPINLVDTNGLFAIEVGLGGSLAIALGFEGTASFALAFNFSTGVLEYGITRSLAGRSGYGAFAGGGLNFSVTPGADSICDLEGWFGGVAGEVGVGLVGGGGQLTLSNAGPTISVSPLGAGYGAFGGVTGGYQQAEKRGDIRLYGN